MKEAELHRQEFLSTAKEIEDELATLVTYFNHIKGQQGVESELFRMVHSLKSGAGFLGLTELEDISHSLESEIDLCVKGDSDIMDLEEQLKSFVSFLKSYDYKKREPKELVASETDKPAITESFDQLKFDQFEKEILEESWRRGDKLYRMICHIDKSEQLKHARAYLILNNLELAVNVVKTVPSLENENADFSKLTIFFSTDLNSSSITKLVDIDQVNRVELISESFETVFTDLPLQEPSIWKSVGEENSKSYIKVEEDSLEELQSYILSLSLGELKDSEIKIVKGMKSVLDGMIFSNIGSWQDNLKKYLQELSERQENKIDLYISGESIPLKRSLINHLITIFQQLIRNSASHGIESPETRIMNNKSENGRIDIDLTIEDDNLVIIYKDDGNGMDEEKLKESAISRGLMDAKSNKSILEIISLPGFSTSEVADIDSGRGVGLDLVLEIVEDKLGGSINLINDKGNGITFKILLPRSYGKLKFFTFVKDSNIYALSSTNCKSLRPFDPEKLIVEDNSLYLIDSESNEIVIIDENGKAMEISELKDYQNYIIIRYLGKESAILCNEILMEKEWSSEDFSAISEVTPYIKRVELTGGEGDILLISPEIVDEFELKRNSQIV